MVLFRGSSDVIMKKTLHILCLVVFTVSAFTLVRADDEDDDEKSDVGTVIGIDLGTTYSW